MCFLYKSSFEIDIFIVLSMRFDSLQLMISIQCYRISLRILVEPYSIQQETISNSSVKCVFYKCLLEINIFIVYSLRFHSLELMISIQCYWLWLWILVEAYSIQKETKANSSSKRVFYKSSREIDVFIVYSLRLDFLQLMVSIQ